MEHMTKYSIFSICTKNYRDAYNFVIDSWLKNTQAEKIYIYTDDETWTSDNNRLEFVLTDEGNKYEMFI